MARRRQELAYRDLLAGCDTNRSPAHVCVETLNNLSVHIVFYRDIVAKLPEPVPAWVTTPTSS